MNMCHARAKFQNEFEGILRSKTDFRMHMGFRKVTSNVIFSQIYSGSTKFKFQRRIKADLNWHLVSFFAQTMFPPANFILFAEQEGQQNLAMIGSLLLPDLFKVILKRIILTGHPIKAKKKKATVKFMFFNTEDIRYFMKNEVYTKKGLKGKIQEPVGTHGLMKAVFNSPVKQSDTICMNLYKRVFPKLNDDMRRIK
jgi:pre-rRNA-processing protein TSR1